jgi:molybdopterin-guanine dinucleotide biosynthesis protein A
MPDAMPPATLGVLLAGGLARRMGGGDKTLRTVGGRTILERAIGVLGPQCASLILNANGDPARFAATGLPVVPDSVPDFAGPLAGVLAGLDWCAAHHPGIDWIVTVAADSPFLPDDLVRRLHAARIEAGVPMAQAESAGRSHPVNALWPVLLRGDLRRALVEEQQRKVGAFGARHGVATAGWDIDPVDPFFNANAPDDVDEADRLARHHGL